jgi:CDP-diacylglycerol--glycerol-3-phosphate 3-phosphatidyltransferase
VNTQKVVPRKKRPAINLPGFRKNIASYLTGLTVRLFARTPITPNIITCFGFVITLGAAALIITGHLFAAGFVVLIAGFFDMIDGALARSTNRVTQFGAVLDSTLDRLSEAAILLSLLFIYAMEQYTLGISVVSLALIASLLVSYIRSRAEALGIECEVGIFTRAERIVLLSLGLLLSQINYALIVIISVIAFFSIVTINQRLIHVWRQTKK